MGIPRVPRGRPLPGVHPVALPEELNGVLPGDVLPTKILLEIPEGVEPTPNHPLHQDSWGGGFPLRREAGS